MRYEGNPEWAHICWWFNEIEVKTKLTRLSKKVKKNTEHTLKSELFLIKKQRKRIKGENWCENPFTFNRIAYNVILISFSYSFSTHFSRTVVLFISCCIFICDPLLAILLQIAISIKQKKKKKKTTTTKECKY